MRFLKTVVLISAAIFICPNAIAQLPKTDALASEMAEVIVHSKRMPVIVFDFWGPAPASNALGQYFAEEFSAELAGHLNSDASIDRSKIVNLSGVLGLSPSDLRDPKSAGRIGDVLGAESVILGQLEVSGDNLAITITAYRISNAKRLREVKTSFAMTGEMRALIANQLPGAPPRFLPYAPPAGKEGYTNPKCIDCQQAHYSNEALDKHLQGTVTLSVIVGTDGRAHDFLVVKGLPYGLSEEATEAVAAWTFRPALGPDGQPAAVRQTIELTFHLHD